MSANGADRWYSDARCAGAGRYEAMAQGADCFNPPANPVTEREPWYCRAIKLLDRNCISVRAYAKAFGRAEAERRARICGATDEQIAEAQACFTTK